MLARLCTVLAAGLALPATAAHAEDLFTVWSLQPQGAIGEVTATEDQPFAELRLVPLHLVRLTEPVQMSRRSQLPAGTALFAVFQADGQVAYCTIKDQSDANAARSAFIPILDRRPCFVDADRDGRFEARFNVFDKYGSALTPSGNLSSARELDVAVGYAPGDPADFPVARTLAFSLTSIDDPARRAIAVQYDNGRGYVPMVNTSPDSTPVRPTALNIAADVLEAQGNAARLRVAIDTTQYVVGDSDGNFVVLPLPEFARGLGG